MTEENDNNTHSSDDRRRSRRARSAGSSARGQHSGAVKPVSAHQSAYDFKKQRQKQERQQKKQQKKEKKALREHKPNAVARLANQWFDRVMGAVKEGDLAGQEAEYASHRTTRDFVFNTIGVGSWGLVFPAVTMISTHLVGTEKAGMISMAFTVGMLLMYLANFGTRTYQVSDINENHSFTDYQITRWITCIGMILVGALYCKIRGYDAAMFNIAMGIFAYKMVDGLSDVYEGRLQQTDKLYLAGISQMMRSLTALLVFTVVLFITRNAVAASFAMAIAAAAVFLCVTYPLSLLETPRSRRASIASIVLLLKNTAPLFLAIFLFNLIDALPKFVMEGLLAYDNQLYYNALYFPAQGIVMTSQLVYKPLLVRMAGVWQDASKRRQFDMIMGGILLVIVGITVVNVVIMAWIGIPILGFLYGVDFEDYRGLLYIMIAAGGVTAAIDFLYQVITVMRRQKDVTALYLVTFLFALLVTYLLISFTGLPGAMLSFLIFMSFLFVLLVWEYLRIRGDIAHGNGAAAPTQVPAPGEPGGASAEGAPVDAARAGVHAAPPADTDAADGVSAGQPQHAGETHVRKVRRVEPTSRRPTNRRQ